MIGTHNTYTYLPCVNSTIEQFDDYWRCQDKTITEQYQCGARFFDIRVTPEVDRGKTRWRCCHGIAEVQQRFTSMETLLKLFTKSYPGSIIRVILEKGDDTEFRSEIARLKGSYPVLKQAIIKKNWEVLYEAPDMPEMRHYSYCQWDFNESFIDNIKNNLTSSIKIWAAEHNPHVTQEMIDDPNVIYFMNYF